jgi:hypothetical protein
MDSLVSHGYRHKGLENVNDPLIDSSTVPTKKRRGRRFPTTTVTRESKEARYMR